MILWASVGLVGCIVVFVAGFWLLIEVTPLDTTPLEATASPTVVYAKDGSVLMDINASGSTDLTYQQLPANLVNALVATEDHSYWTSSSIDLRGILRSAFVDLWSRSLAQGGSTIQEQLAKIVYLNQKKTFSRKIQQIALGVQINRHFSKQEILAMYMNRVFLGENTLGVEQAALRYFGVDLRTHPDALTLAQAALLAGLPRAPSFYDPLANPKYALLRRNTVLQNMVKYGYLTQAQATATESQPLGATYHSLTNDAWDAQPLLTQFLFDYANRNHILTTEELLQGGLKIYTTIDPTVQAAINDVFWNNVNPNDFPQPMNGAPVPGGALFLDPATGGILGAAGARQPDFYRGGLDRVFVNTQPGSSIKPMMEYAPAIESGKWTPASLLDNRPQDFNGYMPHNDGAAPAQVTLRYALQWSENIASVWLLQQIGIQTGADFAQRDGIQLTAQDRQHLGIAIGGLEYGVNPLEMAQGYAPFANGGVQMQAHLLTRVLNRAGDQIYSYVPQQQRIMSAHTAAVMTQLMENVVQHGTGVDAQVPGWPVAGKTGTVQFDPDLTGPHPSWVRDVWFDGYTPNLVGSVYLGYDLRSDLYHLNWSPYPGIYTARIFADIVHRAEAGVAPQAFPADVTASGTGASTPPVQDAVVGLAANWDAVGGGVQLTWQSSLGGSASFVIDRAVASNATSPGNSTVTADASTNGTGAASSGNSTGTGSHFMLLGQTNELTYEDTSVLPGITYQYLVQAVDQTTGLPVGSAATVAYTSAIAGSSVNTGATSPGNVTGNATGGTDTGTANVSGSAGGVNGTGNETGVTNGTVPGAATSNGVNATGNGTEPVPTIGNAATGSGTPGNTGAAGAGNGLGNAVGVPGNTVSGNGTGNSSASAGG